MQALTGPALIGATLLIVAGLPKVAFPTATVAALRSVGATGATRAHVRGLSFIEVALGVAALAYGSVVIDLGLALTYAGFSGFLVLALRPGSGATGCGCTARRDTRPTYSHLALTVTVAALAALAAAFGGHTGIAQVDWSSELGAAAGVALFVTVATWLAWAVMNQLGEVRVVRAVDAKD